MGAAVVVNGLGLGCWAMSSFRKFDVRQRTRSHSAMPEQASTAARALPMLAPKGGEGWTDAELSEIRRLEIACNRVDRWDLDCERTDAGDPWCIIYDRQQHRIILHVSIGDTSRSFQCKSVQYEPRRCVLQSTSLWTKSVGKKLSVGNELPNFCSG
jgi:hypothetical protein